MCIAILNTKGTTLKKEILKNCWLNNGDGAGMLYSDDNGKMYVHKEMKDFESFYSKYTEVKRTHGRRRNVVLHFRISTHGRVNLDNCHPFMVDENLGFVHNGMIYDVPESKDYSDTYMFNEHILKRLKPGFEYDETILDMLEMYIGSGSKLIFLNSDDDFAIVNEKAGHWNLGCWFSNTSYQRVNDWVDFGGKKVKKGASTGSYGSTSKDSWGSSYRAYGWTAKSYGDWDDWDTTTTKKCCDECDGALYGVNEIERGTCNDCEDRIAELMGDDICECCGNDFGAYNREYSAYVCSDCMTFVEGEDSSTDQMGA